MLNNVYEDACIVSLRDLYLNLASMGRDRMRMLNSLFKLFSDSEKKASSHLLSELLSRARQLYDADQFESAWQLCAEIQEQVPGAIDSLELGFDLASKLRKFNEFSTWLQRGMKCNPDSAELYFLQGHLYLEEEKLDEALRAYGKAIEISPGLAKAHNGLGVTFQMLGRLDEAYREFKQALALDATCWKASYNIGNLIKLHGQFEHSVEPFQQALFSRRTLRGLPGTIDGEDSKVTRSKLIHDIEQFKFLAGQGIQSELAGKGAEALSQALEVMEPLFSSKVAAFPAEVKPIVAPYINRLTNFYNAPALPGGALNQDQDWAAIEAAYFAHAPGIAYIDNFLKPEALASLRRFCLESTIWFDGRYGNGYVGCSCEDGFICPLLAQIAEEQRLALPAIFGEHRIKGLWGYKYDSEQTGIATHADFAAVNVNFWLTPDDANLDPSGGGLVIWDKEAPLDWNFHDYNANVSLISEFLRNSGAKEFVVPHKQNRVVLFNSDLFHKTDNFHFKPGYENRRINVTMLYGDRHAG